jgi:transposase
VAEQARVIEQLTQRIADLEARLAKDSHNSSKPPSSDPPFRKPPPLSRRKASGRKPGGQKGHNGVARMLVDEPDETVVVALEGVCACGRCRAEIPAELAPERRQVVELVVRREVTKYRVVAGAACAGACIAATFPRASPPRYSTGQAYRRSPSR